ncbi:MULTISPECIES: hypothetical protein [Klebsiella pneumoniae complex]|uniref:hypothetical protein n=1 Tax=Klebsiella pneumoniae complex TaxID=3390273 RepID=UPI001F5E4E93|nr:MULTISPECIES: hypothetical protein [Klebsiella]
MTKSTITRERLQEIAEDGFLKQGESKELARIALAAMDSEPDCKERKLFCSTDTARMRKAITVSAGTDVAQLYRHAQPVEQENDMSRICAESYQVVGALAEALNIFDDPCVIKALDNLSAQELVHEDVLPFSVDESAQPAPEKYNIGDATMRHIFTPTGMTDVSDMQAVFDRVEAVLVGMDQPAPVVPDGYVMVPMRLTAENGAKGALSGEFSETKFVNCPECFGDDECEKCDGSGKIEITVPVTWTTIKAIWVKGVEHFAVTAQEND